MARWFAVRCVFENADPDAEIRQYEERLTLWRAGSFDEAIERAEAEAVQYAADNRCVYLELAQSFALFEHPSDGSEIFSLIRDSSLSPAEYLQRHFDTGEEHQQG